MAYRRWARAGSVTSAVFLMLCVGLALPAILTLYHGEAATDAIEAPGDAFVLSGIVELAAVPGIRIERGSVASIDSGGNLLPASAGADGGTQAIAGLRVFNGTISLGSALGSAVAPLSRTLGAATDATPRPASALEEALRAGRYETLSLRHASVVLNGFFETPETLTDVKAEVSLRRRGTVAITGTGLLRGHRVTFDATANSSQAERRNDGLHRIPLKLSLKGEHIDASFDGRLVAGSEGVELQGQGELAMPSGRGLARWFGAYWPGVGGLRDMSVRGQVRFGRDTLTFENALARMDGNEATGVLGLRLGQPRPVLTGTLAYKSFDARPYIAGISHDYAGAMSWSAIASGALTVPLGMHLDADLRISAERVQLGMLDVGRVAAAITLKDGRLLADVVDLKFNGGEGGGQITADFTGFTPKLNLRGRLEEVDLGLLSGSFAGSQVLQGRAGIVVDLAGAGTTLQDVIWGLAGKIVVRSNTPGRLGLDLRGLATASRDRVLSGWGPAARGTTSYDGLELRLVLRDGTILTETAEARSGDSVWSATGVVNLLTDRIDLRLSQGAAGQIGGQIGGQVGATTSALAAQTVIDVHGPLREPHVRSSAGP